LDALTILGCDEGDYLFIHKECPHKVKHLILADMVEVSTPRMISLDITIKDILIFGGV